MAKMFYSQEEAIAKLGCDEKTLREFARDGKLREFRDAGKISYKVDEVDKLAASVDMKPAAPASPAPPPPPAGGDDSSEVSGLSGLDDLSASLGSLSLADTPGSSEVPTDAGIPDSGSGDTSNPMPDLSASGSIGLSESGGLSIGGTVSDATSIEDFAPGESILGLGDSSGINLAPADSQDIVSLDDDEAEAGGPGSTTPSKSKEDTVVSSVGVSVFDEEDLDESADPLAKTVVSGSSAGGTGLEGVGSGSGLLDLTRESDDTSLGAELLDEIYPGSDESGTGAALEMGEATRAGLEGAAPEEEPLPAKEDTALRAPAAEAAVRTPAAVATTRESAPTVDAFVRGASGVVVVALLVLCFTGLAISSMIRGIYPLPLQFVYGKLWMFGLGALVASGLAMGLGVFLGRRSHGS